MALKDGVYPVVSDIAFTTVESYADIDKCYKLILLPDNDALISLNDNTHYKKYPKGQAIPIEMNSENSNGVTRIYVKGQTASGSLGLWGYR